MAAGLGADVRAAGLIEAYLSASAINVGHERACGCQKGARKFGVRRAVSRRCADDAAIYDEMRQL